MMIPAPIRAKADVRGKEYAWRRTDLPEVIDACHAQRVAVIGGQVQFRLPDGTCEMYWHSFDSTPRGTAEVWDAFVARAKREVLEAFGRLPPEYALLSEGEASFEFLREKRMAGIDLGKHLWYVCYFAAPRE